MFLYIYFNAQTFLIIINKKEKQEKAPAEINTKKFFQTNTNLPCAI